MDTWTCHRCGACCTRPSTVTLTGAEFAELLQVEHRATRRPIADQTRLKGFLALAAGPCPFYAKDAADRAMCLAYEVRPYNCRRYMCGRETCREEWDPRAIPMRVQFSRALESQYARNQAKHMPWAKAHGWIDEEAPA